MKIELSEVLRYIGAKTDDGQTAACAKSLIEQAEQTLSPEFVLGRFNVCRAESGGYRLEGTQIVFSGKLIDRILGDAKEVVLFVATLTLLSEKMLKTCFAKSAFDGLVCDGVMSAAIESVCDEIEADVRKEAEQRGLFAKPRISCGYGDFPLRAQKDIYRLLSAEKRLGVKLNDSMMVYPNKTVSALIAISDKECGSIEHCAGCGLESCRFRRKK